MYQKGSSIPIISFLIEFNLLEEPSLGLLKELVTAHTLTSIKLSESTSINNLSH